MNHNLSTLISKKQFKKLLERFLKDDATEHEKRWVEKWYTSLEKENNYPVLSEEERTYLSDGNWKKLQEKMHAKPRTILLWPSLAAAAVLVLAITFVLYQSDDAPTKSHPAVVAADNHQLSNPAGQINDFLLPDSTIVSLGAGSSLRLAANFNENERQVFLQGEAFFKVSHNANKPFYVTAGGLVTRVLGTSFRVSALPNNAEVIVTVKTGKVSVYKASASENDNNEDSKIHLTPNQQAIFDRATDRVSKKLISDPEVIIPPRKLEKMRFTKRPVQEVFAALQEMYGIDMQYDEELLQKCILTTSLDVGSLYSKLDIICDAIGATYQIEGTVVKIQSDGCH